uniref:Regulatory protein zeste n=1 Tax=Diabrotica virgifera virgifera TaxID=50390 RepID=A0A6P7GXB8_DIAVI
NRSTNFSKEEELLLLQEIDKYKSIVECKTTNKVNNKEKDEAWQKIVSNFNAKNFKCRTFGQIKNNYDNLKTRTRKVVANDKVYLRGTGGGPAIKTVADPVVEATLNIISGKTVVGHIVKIDSDEMVPWENVPSTSKMTFEEKMAVDIDNEEIENQILEKTVSEQIHEPIHEPKPEPPTKKAKIEGKSNWSHYVPNNLRTPTNKKLKPANAKLQPTQLNPVYSAKELYYRRKKQTTPENVQSRR